MLHHTHSPLSLSTSTTSSTSSSTISITSTKKSTSSTNRQLPSVLIDFIAITLCDLLPIKSSLRDTPSLPFIRGRPLPELVYFIQKITFTAGINVRTALVALIYLHRVKSSLPIYAVGSHDTSHRLLLGSLLIASKFLQGSTWTKTTLTNHQLYDLCDGLFQPQEIDQMERAFLKLIQYQCWVD
ncbi:cyclin domain-containing protein, partial [Halteromyces radiatus]|uniref:cyclin domain-containing protein n=1 Tax=Halteromyces radiatus TaxID=101107 RepID=UPI00221E7E0B